MILTGACENSSPEAVQQLVSSIVYSEKAVTVASVSLGVVDAELSVDVDLEKITFDEYGNFLIDLDTANSVHLTLDIDSMGYKKWEAISAVNSKMYMRVGLLPKGEASLFGLNGILSKQQVSVNITT